MAPISLLDGPVRAYAWGSRTTIARMQGRAAPSAHPEAELWFGAHPSDPARLVGQEPGSLAEAVAADPLTMLGGPVVAALGPRLPFLLKILAIDQPLSLQVHPSEVHAAAGFAAEQARGVPLDAPERRYRDASGKPELLHALTPVDAFCGFREPRETLALLDRLAVDELAWLSADLAARGGAALHGAVRTLLGWPQPGRLALVADVCAAAAALAATGGPHALLADWIVRLGKAYPDDPGVAVALLLHLVRLRPGEAIHVPEGNLHAYLHGTAIEVMATSDNVIRGGLTAKHVDVDALLGVVDASPLTTPRVRPVAVPGGEAFPVPTPFFALQRLVPGRRERPLERRGPEILLATDGPTDVVADGIRLRLAPGNAAFVPASTTALSVCGSTPVFRATVGDLG